MPGTPVTVYHNIATDDIGSPIGLSGYKPGQRVVPVFQYDSDLNSRGILDDDYDIIAEEAFRLFNIGDDPHYGEPDPRALEYRRRLNRSVSIGDVLDIDTTWWACTLTGWDQIGEPVILRNLPLPVRGTTPIDADTPGPLLQP